jgi:hypothetical protein
MPKLSAWAVRLALLYLLAGFTAGSLILAQKGVSYYPPVWRLLPVHIEFLMIGWTINLVFGVAYWILPRYTGGSRGGTFLPVSSIILLNLGVLLVAGYGVIGGSPWLLFAGRLLEALAVSAFAASAWRRVRPTVVGAG